MAGGISVTYCPWDYFLSPILHSSTGQVYPNLSNTHMITTNNFFIEKKDRMWTVELFFQPKSEKWKIHVMRNNNEEKCLFGVILRLISSKYEDEASSHSAKPLRSERVKNFIPFSRHNFRFQLYIRKMIVFVDITVFSVLRALFVEQTTK